MSSALDTVRSGLEARLRQNWRFTPIKWPGKEFDPDEKEWVRMTLVFGDGALESMSSTGVNTIEGIALIDVFRKRGKSSGFGPLYRRVDQLRDLFDRVTVGATECLAASGPTDVSDEGWLGLQIEVPFIVEENS